jgi:hypothetical protein
MITITIILPECKKGAVWGRGINGIGRGKREGDGG